MGTGAYPYSGLAEYASRDCRRKLVELVLRCIERELSEMRERGRSHIDGRVSAVGELSRRLGVTRRAVNKWLDGTNQSCNLNTDKLIRLALQYDPYGAEGILREDLEKHAFLLDISINGETGTPQYPYKAVVTI